MLTSEQKARGRAARYLMRELGIQATHAEAQLLYAEGLQVRWRRQLGSNTSEALTNLAKVAQQIGAFRAEVWRLRHQMAGLALRLNELEALARR